MRTCLFAWLVLGVCAPAAANPADEIRLYVDIGREALERGSPGEARSAFESALKRAPGSPPLMGLLGQVMATQGEHAAAVEQLQRAIEGGHAPLAVRRALGMSLYNLRRDAEAEAVLAEVVASHPDDARALYYLGLARHRQQDHQGARAVLRALVEGDGAFAAPAAFIAGTSSYHLGDHDRALADFAVVRRRGSTQLVARAAEMVELSERRTRSWDLVLMVGAEYDANVLQAPQSPGAVSVSGPKSDVAALLVAVGTWRPLDDVRLQYSLFDRHLFELADQRLLGQTASLAWRPWFDGQRPELGYTFNHFLLGGDHYLMGHRLHAGWGWAWNRWTLDADYSAKLDDFAARFDAFDGVEHGPQVRVRWRPSVFDLRLDYRRVWEQTEGTGRLTEGSEYDHTRDRLNLSVGARVGGGVSVSAAVAGRLAEYDVLNPLLAVGDAPAPRSDRRLELTGAVAWQMSAHWLVRAQARFVHNDSNVPVYTFDKLVARLSVGYLF